MGWDLVEIEMRNVECLSVLQSTWNALGTPWHAVEVCVCVYSPCFMNSILCI